MSYAACDTWQQNPIKEIQTKIKNASFDQQSPKKSYASTPINITSSDVANINISTPPKKYRSRPKVKKKLSIEVSEDFDIHECSFKFEHLNKCNKCKTKFNQYVNKKTITKLNNAVDEIKLDRKIKEMDKKPIQETFNETQTINNSNPKHYWKESLIAMLGIICILLVILLIVKALKSKNQ